MCGKTTISRRGKTGSAVMDGRVIGNNLKKNETKQQRQRYCTLPRWDSYDKLSTILPNKETKELCALLGSLGEFGMNYQRSSTVNHHITIDYNFFNVTRCWYVKHRIHQNIFHD